MQGIYKGFQIYSWDPAWTCALDLVQQPSGMSLVEDIFNLIDLSGYAEIKRE